MTLSDGVFDVFLILLYLATPLAWAAALVFQDINRSTPITRYPPAPTTLGSSQLPASPPTDKTVTPPPAPPAS
jgi:hypothetical protein